MSSSKIKWDPARGEAQRPFRIWDAKRKANVAHRHYAHRQKAHMAALVEARWGKAGDSFEVYDCRTMRLLGQYTRTPTSIVFQGS